MKTRYFALVVGIIYLVVGIAGFIPGIRTDRVFAELAVHASEGELLGLFPVNVLHNLVHLLIGVLGILAYRTYDASRLYSRALAIVYAVLAIMGLIAAADLRFLFGLAPLHSHDIWLHALTAIIAAYFGWGPVEAEDTYPEATTRTA